MSKLTSVFSNLFKSSGSKRTTGKRLAFPTELSSKNGIFQYLNFTIPELQATKFALDHDEHDKAFEHFFKYLKTRHTPAAMCSWWKQDEITNTLKLHYPESALALLEAADKILQHKFLLFSAHEIQADTPIAWSRSYEENVGFDTEIWKPGKTYTLATLLEESHNDIHFVWELNRHQHFLDLGKAYWYTGSEAYVEEFMHEINGWITQNPYRQSVNWVNEYEIALRGIFWIFGYAFFFTSDLIDKHFFSRFYQILLYHAHDVYESLLSTPSKSPNAHYIVTQAVFLYILGTIFPEYLHSKTWSSFGWKILQWKENLLSLQDILDESLVHLSNAVECYCLGLMVRANNRYHIPQPVAGGMVKMCERLALFTKPNGNLSRIGETPQKNLFTGMYTRANNLQHHFAMVALLLKNQTIKTFCPSFKESLLWFFGKQGMQNFNNLSETPPARLSSCDPTSPYAIMRSEWDKDSGYCLITTGLDNPDLSQEIKHTDLLSFELYANGQDYLIDSGPYSYHPTDPWNQYFRSAQAHNTITVDRIKSINLQSGHTESVFDQWLSTPTFDFLSGYHTGFEDLDEPIMHRRSIFYYKPNYWILCDLLTGKGQHFFDQYFHFPPFRLNVDFMNKRVDIETKHKHHFMLMPINLSELDVTIFTGGEQPESGWISKGYKKKIAASFIKYGKKAIAPTCFHTLLYAYTDENVLKLSGHPLQVFSQHGAPLLSHEVSAVKIFGDHEMHYFVHLYQEHPHITFNNITFNGSLLFLRTQKGVIMEIILHNATLLVMNEQTLFKSETPVEQLTLRVNDDLLYVLCSGNYTFHMQLPKIQEVFVNNRKAFLKREREMIVVSTLRV